jgi:hypothetical protein
MITPSDLLKAKNFISIFLFVLLLSCSTDPTDDPIPFHPFPDIDITLTNYPALLTDGGYITINDGGVRGIILYRKSLTTYIAFERNCTFQPTEACATVDVHSSTLYLYDACCGSSFNFEGKPTGGPAWRSLQRYQTQLSGNSLIITDEVVD